MELGLWNGFSGVPLTSLNPKTLNTEVSANKNLVSKNAFPSTSTRALDSLLNLTVSLIEGK